MTTPIGWDHPATARAYLRFTGRHRRYRAANRALVAHAGVEPFHRVLDVAAGVGHTVTELLGVLGPEGRVVGFEPAGAMRTAGRRRVRDPRVDWTGTMPNEPESFHRVVCSAAVWQLGPLEETLKEWRSLLRGDGALTFDIPALYLGEADPPGGGKDPLLLALPALVAEEGMRLRAGGSDAAEAQAASEPTAVSPALTDRAGIEELLRRAGLRFTRWEIRVRFTQRALRDWLKIPVLTDRILPGVPAGERERLVDRAFAGVDPRSWRWERWYGWVAWEADDSGAWGVDPVRAMRVEGVGTPGPGVTPCSRPG